MDIAPNFLDAPRVLLIDLDNCPTQISNLPQVVAHFTRVVVCYGGFEPKIHLSQLALLAPALVTGRLAIESMERKGKNAADFGLTFWAGRLLAEMPPETEFLVLSKDADLDYLIDMLRQAGRKVERLDGNTFPSLGATVILPTNTFSSNSENNNIGNGKLSLLGAAAEEYRSVHITTGRPRPARRLTLLNSIRSHFKGSVGIDPEAVLQELIRQGILTMGKNGKIIYRDRVHSGLLSEHPIPGSKVPSELSLVPNIVTTADSIAENIESKILNDAPIVSPQSHSLLLPDLESIPLAISVPADEYYTVRIVNQHARPSKRGTLLNSIRSYFKGQPSVDPDAVIAELFRRGVVSQNRRGILNYHDQSTPVSAPDLSGKLSNKSKPTLSPPISESVVSIDSESFLAPAVLLSNEPGPELETAEALHDSVAKTDVPTEINFDESKLNSIWEPIQKIEEDQVKISSTEDSLISEESAKKSPRSRTRTTVPKSMSTEIKISRRTKETKPLSKSRPTSVTELDTATVEDITKT